MVVHKLVNAVCFLPTIHLGIPFFSLSIIEKQYNTDSVNTSCQYNTIAMHTTAIQQTQIRLKFSSLKLLSVSARQLIEIHEIIYIPFHSLFIYFKQNISLRNEYV